MTADRMVLIESPARLSVDRGRLKIAREGEADRFVAPADVAIVCIEHYATEITKNALLHLTSAGAAVVITDGSHFPAAMILPLQGHGLTAQRIHQQVAFSLGDGPGRLWRQIVAAKIQTQAATLRHFDCNGALRLERLAADVKEGASDKAEAQAARHYWAHLFPDEFRREKQNAQNPINQRLNYGYAVLRALIARQIAMAGLCPALGVGHRSSENPFNLADDFIEPYRFVVERMIKGEKWSPDPVGREDRHRLLSVLQAEVRIKGADYRLPAAVEETVESYCRCLAANGPMRLSLPE